MKILIPTKRVPDTDQKIRVNEDGTGIDDSAIPYIINPFDAIALEEGLRMREGHAPAAEIVAVGIGSEDYEKELRTALAMGADRAVLIHTDDAIDPWNAAVILDAVVKREVPNLVLMGKQAIDGDFNQTGQFLAARLNWPQATFASRIEFQESGLRVERETDLGIETVTVSLPAVVTCDLRLNEPRYASLPSILKSKKKPIERIALGELGVTIQPRVEMLALETVSSTRNCRFMDTAEELISKLRDDVQVVPECQS